MSALSPALLAETESKPGRLCPADYAYPPSVFARAPDISTDVLYVVGGLYGNLAALDAVERLAGAERLPTTIVFNGDFHWFDADAEWFGEVERHLARYPALRGNVETEIARKADIGAGCGCNYPESVGEDIVRRSNDILAQLRREMPSSARARLGGLPMHAVAEVRGLRIGIVHGDAWSLAGWNFAPENLDSPHNRMALAEAAKSASVNAFACTHTCLAALRAFDFPSGPLTVVNNGAAGMPNFSGSRLGLVTRIGAAPSPRKPLYGAHREGVWIDAIPLAYDHDKFLTQFLRRWPKGTPAYASYYDRIIKGPDYSIAQAAP